MINGLITLYLVVGFCSFIFMLFGDGDMPLCLAWAVFWPIFLSIATIKAAYKELLWMIKN